MHCSPVYVHMEAPDECGHRCEPENKVRAIELIDEKVLKPMMEALDKAGEEYSILLMPDHPTPLALRTHTSDPVPFVLYRSTVEEQGPARYTEQDAASTGIYEPEGYTLMGKLMEQ